MKIKSRKIVLISLLLCLVAILSLSFLFVKKDNIIASAAEAETPAISVDKGVSIRVDKVGVRFSAYVRDDVYQEGMVAGMLVIPSDLFTGELTIDTPFVKNISAEVWAKTTQRVGTHQFNAVLTDIPIESYARVLTARAYYVDEGENYVYSNTSATRSIAQASSIGIHQGDTTEALKTYVDNSISGLTISANSKNPLDLSVSITKASGADAEADVSNLQPVWTSSNPSQVVVGKDGNIDLIGTAEGTYSADITATLGTKTARHSFSAYIRAVEKREAVSSFQLDGNADTTYIFSILDDWLELYEILSVDGIAISSPAQKVKVSDLGAPNAMIKVIAKRTTGSTYGQLYIATIPFSATASIDDTTPPTIELTSAYTTSASIGENIVLPTYEVTDNQFSTNSFLSITNPNGEKIRLTNGSNTVVAMMEGNYTISIMAWDILGNICTVEKTVVVSGGEYIKVANPVKVNSDWNNNVSLNTTVTSDLGIEALMAERGITEYTISSVNGVEIKDNVIYVGKIWESGQYGLQDELTRVVVTANGNNYIIDMPVLLVTKVIKTPEDLTSFGNISSHLNLGGYFELGNDIDMNGTRFVAFNTTEAVDGSAGFVGTFDGCGHVIKNAVSGNAQGLVGPMTVDGIVRNVGFVNATVTDNANLIGRTEKGLIENVYVQYKADGFGAGARTFSVASGTYNDGDVTLNNVFVNASALTLTANTYYTLMANTTAASNYMYLMLPADYSSANGYVCGGWSGFDESRICKNYTAAITELSSWGAPWSANVNTEAITFGNYVIKAGITVEEITVPTRVKVDLQLNNDGTVNTGAWTDLRAQTENVLGKESSEFTIKTVNDVAISGNLVPTSVFGLEYGEKDVIIKVETADTRYVITMPVLLVSKTIKTVDDYNNWGTISTALSCGGYFELGNDISDPSGSIAINAWNTVKNFDWNGSAYEADESKGFKGVFDGCGYVIDGITSDKTSQLETFMGAMTSTGVLRNIGFTNVSLTGGESGGNVFLTRSMVGTIENVYVQYKQIPEVAHSQATDVQDATIFAFHASNTLNVNNVFVDASAVTLANKSNYGFGTLGDGAMAGKDIYGITATNVDNLAYAEFNTWTHTGHAFKSHAELRANTTAWATVSAWVDESEYWAIDQTTGNIVFGKTFIANMPKYETINVTETRKLHLNMNTDGTVNATEELSLGIPTIMQGVGVNEYTILTVDGVEIEDNKAHASIFGTQYGEKDIVIIVKAGETTYTINMPVLLVTKIIYNATDFGAWRTMATACGNGGYFELGCKIGTPSTYDGSYTTAFNGTFDGCGYVVDGLTVTGENGLMGAMGETGVLKNIGFTNAVLDGMNFLTMTSYGTLENIYIQYATFKDGSRGFSNVGGDSGVANMTVTNMFIDASALTNARDKIGDLEANINGYATEIYCIMPESTAGNAGWIFGWSGQGANNGFLSYEKMFENETAAADLATWTSPWKFEKGRFFFGETELYTFEVTEAVDASSWDRAKINLNLDSALSTANSEFVGFNLAEKLGVNEVTILSIGDDKLATSTGEQTISLVAKSDNITYNISNMPVFLVSKVIKTVEDYNNWGNISKALGYGGYFELGSDISQEGGIELTNWNTNSYWVSSEDAYKGFAGTFDGCGYVIDGIKLTSNNGLYGGFVGTMTKTGVLKNIGLINVDASAITATSNLIGTTTYGTMENVYIHYSASAANMRTITLAGNGIAVDFTATKVFVDGSDISNTIEFRLVPDPDTTKATGFYGVTPANKDIGCYTGSSNSAYYADTVLNNKLVAAAAIVSWDGTSYWHIDETTGEVTFGRNA